MERSRCFFAQLKAMTETSMNLSSTGQCPDHPPGIKYLRSRLGFVGRLGLNPAALALPLICSLTPPTVGTTHLNEQPSYLPHTVEEAPPQNLACCDFSGTLRFPADKSRVLPVANPIMSVTLHTTLGDIKIEVFCESVPKTAEVGSSRL